jgi:hypothetical protein
MCGAMPLLPLYAFMARTGTALLKNVRWVFPPNLNHTIDEATPLVIWSGRCQESVMEGVSEIR